MNSFLLVGTGGVLGATARYLLEDWLSHTRGLHTFSVNVLGSVVLGALLSAPIDDAALLLFGTGFCGAFTTFSTFAVETVQFYEQGRRQKALVLGIGNLAGALAGVGLGTVLASLVVGNI